MKRTIAAAAAVVAGALALPAAAGAHVTIQPTQAEAGASTVLAVRVPNERDDASTVKVDVRLPAGFVSASWEAVPGWKVRAVKQRLSKPIRTDDGPIDEQVGEIVWTASSKSAGVQPGEFRDFLLSVVLPGKAGQTLTFKALQTYSNGDVERLIGAPGADEPAPQLKLIPASRTTTQPRRSAAAQAPAAVADDDSSNGLSIVALVVGALGLLIGVVALVTARRGPATRP